MAEQAARCFARDGDRLILAARNRDKLDPILDDLAMRGASETHSYYIDLLDFDRHEALIEHAWTTLGTVDIVLVAHGTLDDQAACELSFAETKRALDSNFLSAVSLCTLVANKMIEASHGTLAVISSVAGDRGRQSNYVYGAAKAGLDAFLSGLRNRCHHHGVQVTTIKPGFVDTPMTAHIKKGPLFASAKKAGETIYRAVLKKKNVVYVPWFWWGIMKVIRSIPEWLFKKLKL